MKKFARSLHECFNATSVMQKLGISALAMNILVRNATGFTSYRLSELESAVYGMKMQKSGMIVRMLTLSAKGCWQETLDIVSSEFPDMTVGEIVDNLYDFLYDKEVIRGVCLKKHQH